MMRVFFFIVVTLLFTIDVFAGDFVKTSDGIIVRPDAAFGGNAKEVQLRVIADNIIRITATADKNLTPNRSLVITKHDKQDVKWNVTNTRTSVSLKTAKLTAIVNL